MCGVNTRSSGSGIGHGLGGPQVWPEDFVANAPGGTPRSNSVDLTSRMNGKGPQVKTWTSFGSGMSDKSMKPCRERESSSSRVSYQV
jgi:hypothetical protein